MRKYNVGDLVKLRDDLEAGKKYGKDCFVKEMDVMKNNTVKIIDVNESDYLTNYGWYITDEMIEGLWEECKEKTNKLKLIDVLNMIAKGELKEGTKVKYDEMEYEFRKVKKGATFDLFNEKGEEFFSKNYIGSIRNEVELIEPPCEHECISDDGITLELSKIEELEGKIEALGAVDLAESWMVHYIRENRNKLNEVIRKVNAITNLLN